MMSLIIISTTIACKMSLTATEFYETGMATHHASFPAQTMAFLGPTPSPAHPTDKINLQGRGLQTSHWKNRSREPAVFGTCPGSCHSPRLFFAPSRGKRCHARGLLAFGFVGLVSEAALPSTVQGLQKQTPKI